MQAIVADTWRARIIEEHRQLNEAMERMRAFLGEPRPELGEPGAYTWASEMSCQLVDFHDQLCRHFRYEEQGGMLEELVESHPRAAGSVAEMRDEHVKILEESKWMIGALLSYSEDAATSGAGLRRRLSSMLDQLDEHERHENSLIMDLACSDLGLGD